MNTPIQRSWNRGYTLLMIIPFISLPTILFDLPRWLEIVTVVAIIGLVFFGSRLLFWGKPGGWRPSATLRNQGSDDDR